MKPTLDEEITRIACEAVINILTRNDNEKPESYVASAIYAGIEAWKRQEPEVLAKSFHEHYERLAPSFGYMTNEATRRWNPDSANGRLMIATCATVMSASLRTPETTGEGE